MQPALDFVSRSFDPLLALGSSSVRPPVPLAVPLDNLHQCRRLLPRDHADYLPPRGAPQALDAVAAAEKERAKQRVSYLRQQQARQKERKNPLQEIAEHVKQGPLLLLRRWYEQRQRVRVVTRHERGVRGVAVGVLLAFDKHFNLVLRDVEETYTVLGFAERVAASGKVRCCPKQEHRQRRLKQVFVVGSGVVTVSTALS